MRDYPVVVIPEHGFGDDAGWVYVAEAPPEPRDEIAVYTVNRGGEMMLESETHVTVEAVDDQVDPPRITATWLD
jgi:hypothetical protein